MSDIAKSFTLEKQAYAKVLAGEDLHGEIPTHLAIFQVCQSIGFNLDDTLAIIMDYAQRNELMHINFVPLIQAGNFKDLSTIRHNDFCDLHLIVEPNDFAESELMKNLLESIIDTWFDRREDQPHRHNHGLWVSSKRLWVYWGQLQDPKKGVTDVTKEMSNDIMHRLREVRRQHEKDNKVKEIVSAYPRSR